MKLLCFNPHNDDVIIGAGGTLIKLLNKGWEVDYVYFTDGRHGSNIMSPEETFKVRAEEGRKERESLGINDYWDFRVEDGTLGNLDDAQKEELKNRILDIIKISQPDIILIPSGAEMHSDHRATHDLVYDVLENKNLDTLVMKYIVWSFPDFFPKRTDVSDKILLVCVDNEFEKKLNVIKLHVSQIKEGKYDKIIENFNSVLGLIFKAYRTEGPEKAEIVALFNRNENNRNIEDRLLQDLDNPRDVTTIFHGRQDKKIKA